MKSIYTLINLWPFEEIYLFLLLIGIFLSLIFLIFRLFFPSKQKTSKAKTTVQTKDYKSSPNESFQRALSRTRNALMEKLDPLLGGKFQASEECYNTLEELLVSADLGFNTASKLIQELKQAKLQPKLETHIEKLRMEILNIFNKLPSLPDYKAKPTIIMVVGVNGTGKTTTSGKLANYFNKQGKKVVLAAADTFRAAAGEQLKIWADRANAKIISHTDGADPSAVVYDAIEHAIAKDADFVIADTAGRLHTKKNLMEELKKIHRVIKKKIPEAPHEVLLVLDATSGQNALNQAKLFHDALKIDSIAITRLDGTAKGGILVQIANELNIPIRYTGIGEGINDLEFFSAKEFVGSLLNLRSN